MIKLSYGIPIVLLSAAVLIVQPQVAVISQTRVDVNAIAKQITVRIDGANTGSGVIIDHQGNTYTVLTNEHVVRLNGNYTIQTPDGRRYNFNQSIVKYFSGVDLAVLQFNSTENYLTSNLGNSQQLSEGTTIYVAGWVDPDAGSSERGYKFLPGNISQIVRNPKEGYAWVYTNQTRQGMSGGPVLDVQGRLVGINGRLQTNPETSATDYFGIPINTYLKLASAVAANPQPQAASISKPSNAQANRNQELGNLGSKTPSAEATSPFPPDKNILALANAQANHTYQTLTNFALANTLTGHSTSVSSFDTSITQGVNSVAISPDGKTLATGGYDNTITIWNLATGREILTLKGHSDTVHNIAISPDGKTLVSADINYIKIWNLATGQEIRTLKHYSFGRIAISPDGKTLVSGNIKIWNLATGQEIRTLTGHQSPGGPLVYSIAITPDSKTLVTGSNDDTIKIWNLVTGQEIRTLKVGHTVHSVAISLDGKTLVSGSFDSTLKIWNIATGKLIRTLQGHVGYGVNSVAISPDSKTLASGGYDKTIKIWNLATGQLIRTLQGHLREVLSIAISPDGKTLVSGSRDNTIKIWRVSER